jgi:hypothetical protein
MLDPGEANSPYTLHKLQLENIIQKNVERYYIFRVSQIVGQATNPNTVLNFFYYHIQNQINFDIWVNAYRNIIDIDHVFLIIDRILKTGILANRVIHVANPQNYRATDIVAALEEVTGKTACSIPIDKGFNFEIDISLILPVIKELKIDFRSFLPFEPGEEILSAFMTYKEAVLKRRIEHIAILPLVWLGKLAGKIFPLKTKNSIFLFFAAADLGGAPKVNLDITECLKENNPLIIFSKKPKNNKFLPAFQKTGVRFIDLSKKIDNKLYHFINIFYRGVIASWINAAEKPVVFGGETLYFYKIIPHIKKTVKVVELCHLNTGSIIRRRSLI